MTTTRKPAAKKPAAAKPIEKAAGPALQSEAFMDHAIARHRGPVIKLALARTRNKAAKRRLAASARAEDRSALAHLWT